MHAQEVRRGTRVRVSEGHRRPELQGLLGTVAQRWGNFGYTALLVRWRRGDTSCSGIATATEDGLRGAGARET